MSNTVKVSFREFLNRFEEVELPISIGTETHMDFHATINPMPVPMVETFFIDTGILSELDEFTEIIPVMKIPATSDFHAVISWKAGLLDYEYWLMTFDKVGNLIDKLRIAGTKVMDNLLLHAVVTITEELEVHVIENGRAADDETNFDPTRSLRYQFQLLEDGFVQEEEPDTLL